MSDGPHRSLPLKPRWKKVAEYASNGAHDIEDVCDALSLAVEKDWHEDIPFALIASIREALDGCTLFADDTIGELDTMRHPAAGPSMTAALLDHLALTISSGKTGSLALFEAARNTVTDWSMRHARQIEEHYMRKSNMGDTARVRARIDEAFLKADVCGFLARLLNRDEKPRRKLEKHTGLDDGPSLTP